MKRFPEAVRSGMREIGAAVTCLPVRLDENDWETAVFFQLGGPECREDRRVLGRAERPVPVAVETELMEEQQAAVAMLRFEVDTVPDDPLAAEVLLTPGDSSSHFETLALLTRQPRLCWFFGDREFHVIASQHHPLGPEHHAEFDTLLKDAVRHDSLVRLTRSYDARAALSSVVAHYQLRAGVLRTEYASNVDPSGHPPKQ